ncbi:MAG: InlB B-repeat-containing protein, partial [Paludibacteraceae bacterium]|nr:InlB B-repeat-containing protein [Paludibacteraceae bacterium]
MGRNKYGDVYSSDVTSSSVYVQGVPSYTLTYSVGDVAGNDGSITSSPSTASGSSVQSGNTVTLTAPSAKTGYTWKGWYGNSDGSGAQLCSTAAYAITVSDNTTVYACYTENDYTVTVAASSGGSVASTSVTGHKDTKVTLPTATANTGYYFTGWTTTSGYATYTNQYSATSAQVNGLTAAATVTANFAPIWTIAGSDELGEWDANTNTLWQTYVDATVNYAYFDITTLEPNKDYTFKVVQRSQGDYVWWRAETDAEETINYGNSNTRLNIVDSDGDNFTMHTAGKGTYTFDINLDNNKHPIKVHYPTSYTVTFGYGTGGSAVSATVEDATTITTGQYAAEGKDVTFTQTPTTGYTFKGWYDASSGGSAISSMTSDNVYDDIAANINVYAQYTENMTTVTLAHTGNGHIEIGGATVTETTAGVATTRTITAVPDAGYYFAGWVVSDGSDCTVASTAGRDDNESSSTTLTGSGAGTTGTVTANFVECEKIYFRDIFDDGSTVTHWGDVYVNLGITWNGSNQAITNSTNASWRVHMTQITGTNVWWAYVPRNYTVSSNKNVGFSKDNQNDLSYTFYNTKAATRGDYNKALNMFVPYHTAKTTGNNSVDYFDNGYWMKYDTKADQGAGYYLKQYNSRNDYTQKGEFTANTDDATTI